VKLLIRTLLMWLLVLAVPAQGAAAATMVFCGPSHFTVAKYAHQGDRTAHNHRAQASQLEEHDTASANGAAPLKVASVDAHTCSACASCCSAAILHAVLSMPAEGVSLALFADGVPSVDAFATDGPDRPPRLVLA
jgi:hypothetical protein